MIHPLGLRTGQDGDQRVEHYHQAPTSSINDARITQLNQ
jgi:hypothetical protein